MQEVQFLSSARRRMLIDNYMHFREDSLNGFQVIKRIWATQTDRQTPRGKTICLPTLEGKT